MVKEIFKKTIYNRIAQYERCHPVSYCKSQWENKTGKVNKLYIAYRWLHLLAVATIFFLSIVEYGKATNNIIYYLKWPVFLTNWALTALLAQAIMAAYLVTVAFSTTRSNIGSNNSKNGRLRIWIKVYSIVHSTAVVIAIGVSFVYWIFIYNPEVHELDLLNYLVHGANSIIMLIDFLLVGHPFKLAHSIYPLSLIFIYTIFNYFYYQFGGTDRKGNAYIYKVMDWRYPTKCLTFSLAGHVLVCVIYALLWLIFLGKRKLSIAFRLSSLKVTTNDLSATAPNSVSLV
ncbi:hypothetical protein O3M35_004491 [Rhynocoris fuscipes]|uniref:Protein rolling stone n=1 Tax=Rhynocoris fuscipes TaxID=488301 RepID=A0AAW1CLK0_9HEMI